MELLRERIDLRERERFKPTGVKVPLCSLIIDSQQRGKGHYPIWEGIWAFAVFLTLKRPSHRLNFSL